MNVKKIGLWALLWIGMLGSGCAYRYYFGMHGPTIRLTPEIHQNARTDRQCLKCHDPDGDPTGPPTTHPHFKGCLKCHNDEGIIL